MKSNTQLKTASAYPFAVLAKTADHFVVVGMKPKTDITKHLDGILFDAMQLGFDPTTQNLMFSNPRGHFVAVHINSKNKSRKYRLVHTNTNNINSAMQIAKDRIHP